MNYYNLPGSSYIKQLDEKHNRILYFKIIVSLQF